MFVHLLWSDFTFGYDNMLFILYPAGKIHKFSVPFRDVVEAYANFGINSLDELPIINSDKVEDFKAQALEEAEEQLNNEEQINIEV